MSVAVPLDELTNEAFDPHSFLAGLLSNKDHGRLSDLLWKLQQAESELALSFEAASRRLQTGMCELESEWSRWHSSANGGPKGLQKSFEDASEALHNRLGSCELGALQKLMTLEHSRCQVLTLKHAIEEESQWRLLNTECDAALARGDLDTAQNRLESMALIAQGGAKESRATQLDSLRQRFVTLIRNHT